MEHALRLLVYFGGVLALVLASPPAMSTIDAWRVAVTAIVIGTSSVVLVAVAQLRVLRASLASVFPHLFDKAGRLQGGQLAHDARTAALLTELAAAYDEIERLKASPGSALGTKPRRED